MVEQGKEYARREAERARRVRAVADEAQARAKELNKDALRRGVHISSALAGQAEGRERDRLFGEVRTELNRRMKEEQERKRQLGDAREVLDAEQAERTRQEAYAHAKRMNVEGDTAYDPTMPDEDV